MSPDPIKPTNGNGNGHNQAESEPDATPLRDATTKPLSPKQRAAAWALACGKTWKTTSEEVHCDIRTIAKWQHVPGFREAVAEGTDLMLSICAPAEAAARYRIAEAAPEAAEFVVDTLRNENEETTVRLKAADRILDAAGIGAKGAGTQVNVAVDARTAVDATYSEVERRRAERGEAPPR